MVFNGIGKKITQPSKVSCFDVNVKNQIMIEIIIVILIPNTVLNKKSLFIKIIVKSMLEMTPQELYKMSLKKSVIKKL